MEDVKSEAQERKNVETNREQFKRLWKQSDPRILNDNGQTVSGLIRIFIPAHKASHFDKYGYPDSDTAYKLIMNERKSCDPKDLAGEIRKNPLNEREMFYINDDECMFDSARINFRLEELEWMDDSKLYHRGILKWTDGFGSKVKFMPSNNGPVKIRIDLDPNDETLWNNGVSEGAHHKPNSNNHAGIDPFSHDKVKYGTGSLGGCYVGWKHDAANPEKSTIPFLEYLHRPKTAALFYEDMAKILWFCGCDATIEDNKIGLINFLKDKGMRKFIKVYDEKEGLSDS